MYKKQRPKLSVSAVINSAAQNPSTNWFNGTNGNCSVAGGSLTTNSTHHPHVSFNQDNHLLFF